MTKNEMRKDRKRNKLVKDLKKEYTDKNELLKRIKEHPRVQVQVILKRDYGYGGSMMFDDALDKLSLDIKESKLKLETKFQVINPILEFQTKPEWRAIQIEVEERNLKEYNENFKTLTEQTAKAKKSIAEQEARFYPYILSSNP